MKMILCKTKCVTNDRYLYVEFSVGVSVEALLTTDKTFMVAVRQ